jgi:uncharacterized protein YjbJ (UPF0337 family)
MSHDKAAEAREGLFDSVAGKAKEVAGAVTGKDDLVEEGQLQQAEARHRKDAVADDALAEAKRDEAAQELRETTQAAAEQKEAAHDQADLAQRAVDREKAEEHAAATRAAERQEAVGVVAAEKRADELAESRLHDAEAIAADATTTEQRAAAEQIRLEREDAAADQQAAQLRAQTEK